MLKGQTEIPTNRGSDVHNLGQNYLPTPGDRFLLLFYNLRPQNVFFYTFTLVSYREQKPDFSYTKDDTFLGFL